MISAYRFTFRLPHDAIDATKRAVQVWARSRDFARKAVIQKWPKAEEVAYVPRGRVLDGVDWQVTLQH